MGNGDSYLPKSLGGSTGSKLLDEIKEDLKEDIRELKKTKVDRYYVDVKLEHIDKELKDRKKSSDTLKMRFDEMTKLGHPCVQIKVLEQLQESVKAVWKILDSWRNLKFATIIALIVLVSGAVANYVSLKSSVEVSIEKSDEVKKGLDSVKEELQTSQIEDKKAEERRNKEVRREMKEAFKEALFEVRADITPGRTGN